MKLVVDESVEREIADSLRLAGHDVVYVAELAAGISDDEVLDYANTAGALLVTADKDFGELVYRLGRVHHGVVLVRMMGCDGKQKSERVVQVLRDHATECGGAIVVIAPGQVRIRPRA